MTEAYQWLLVVLCLPWVIYMAVKLGTYAFYKGRALFHEEEEEKANGKKS